MRRVFSIALTRWRWCRVQLGRIEESRGPPWTGAKGMSVLVHPVYPGLGHRVQLKYCRWKRRNVWGLLLGRELTSEGRTTGVLRPGGVRGQVGKRADGEVGRLPAMWAVVACMSISVVHDNWRFGEPSVVPRRVTTISLSRVQHPRK